GNPHQALKDKGYVAFDGNPKGGKISVKGKIKAGKLDFDDVYFVKDLKFNLFSVSQMYDKKNSVLFTDTECVVLSSNFKLPDENHVLLKVPRENNMYNVDLKNVMPSGDLTCLFAKDTLDESNLWYRRLGHINFKTMNKLVKGNIVRGLPSKVLKIIILVLLVRRASKIEPLFYRMKGIKREFNVARTPQQNGVAERKNRTLIEAARTMLADSLLPISFWAEAVNTACYVQNRVLVTKPHNKTPYELLLGNLDVGKVRKETVSTQQYVLLPLWSTGFKDPQNIDAATTIDVKGNETEVHVSPSSSDKPKKHDEKAKREAKGKRPVDFAPVTAVRPNPTNSTNSFNAASPSDNAVSPNFEIGGKSSFVDPS
nr:ribonuclease H-like domain-containing protein [Tanacetum cinerariifolium]